MIDVSSKMNYYISKLDTENTRIAYQMASGKVLDKGSDDASVYAQVTSIESKLKVTQNLLTQMDKTIALNDTADSTMSEIKSAIEDIKVDLLKGLNDGMDRSDKLALATNLSGIRDNIFDLTNLEVDGEYVFSGSVTNIVPLEKSADFETTGKVTFEGDGFLRSVAVAEGSYRDRGITAYDVVFYNESSATAGEEFIFSEDNTIIDEDGYEWKLSSDKTSLQKYDKNGDLESPLVELAVTLDTAATTYPTTVVDTAATYKVSVPTTPEGRIFEAKHNYFDDLNVIINALEGYTTQADGTKGVVISDDEVDDILNEYLDRTSQQYDSTNIGHGELGGRNSVFETAYDSLSSKSTHYKILLEEVGSADLTALALESQSLEITYAALYSTISKMNQMSLVNYLN